MPNDTISPITAFVCYNSNVTILVNGSGSYLWNTGDTLSSMHLNNVVAGSIYTVTVSLGVCQQILQSSVFVNPQMFIHIDSTNVNCYSGNNGSAIVTMTGGAFPYSYLWSNGQTTNPAVNLTSGNYSVTVTEGSTLHCIVTSQVSLTQPNAPLRIRIDSANNICFGQNEGWINATVSGGTLPYTYLWNNGLTTDSIVNLLSGIYTVTITDFNHCNLIRNVNISQPNRLAIRIDSSNVSCNGLGNGHINAFVTGGTSPYNYLWNNAITSPGLPNLSPGNYTLTVSDNNGCLAFRQVTIVEPLVLTLRLDSQNIKCYGENNGWTNVAVTGGTNPYTYRWNNGITNALNPNLPPGNYSVHVTDAHNCTTDGYVSVSQPDSLSLHYSFANVLCYGENSGWLHVTLSGGVSPYQYHWSNNMNTDSIFNLVAGNYSVTVTDYNLCKLIRNFTISEPLPLSLTINPTDETCLDYCNGRAAAVVSGGVIPYNYVWATIPVQNDTVAVNLCAGNISVIVTDANQCTISGDAAISTSTLIQASFIPSPSTATVPANIGFSYTGSLADTYHWDFGDGTISTEVSPAHYYTRDSLYDVRLTVNSGYPNFCSDTYIYQLKIAPISSLFVPSAFTPNDDGTNDVFRVGTYAIKKIEVKIYDRWGQLICEYNNLDGYWDGYVKGELAHNGVYIYNIRAVGYDDVDYRKTGTVTLYCK